MRPGWTTSDLTIKGLEKCIPLRATVLWESTCGSCELRREDRRWGRLRVQNWDSLVSIETIDHVLLKGVDTETVYVVDASIHSFDGIEVVNVV